MKLPTPAEDYLQALIAEGEHLHQDFKFAISDSRKIAKSISAFANTEGGRLLIGVKDNGHIAGVRSEEEIYMIEAAATMYCKPQVNFTSRTYQVKGKTVLEINIAEAKLKPVYAIDETNRAWAYIRVHDENILASPIHLNIWKHDRTEEKVIITYTEREQQLLDILKRKGPLTLTQCCRQAKRNRKEASQLLADFIRFGLAEPVFKEHTFYFQLKENEQ